MEKKREIANDNSSRINRFDVAYEAVPKIVQGMGKVVSISASDVFSVFVLERGSVMTCGDNKELHELKTGGFKAVRVSATTGRVSVLTDEGVLYVSPSKEAPFEAVQTQEKFSDVAEGVFGTLALVGRNRTQLGESFKALLDGTFSDLLIKCGDGELVPCHKCFLLARLGRNSPIVKHLLDKADCSEIETRQPSQIVRDMLFYIYSDRLCCPVKGNL